MGMGSVPNGHERAGKGGLFGSGALGSRRVRLGVGSVPFLIYELTIIIALCVKFIDERQGGDLGPQGDTHLVGHPCVVGTHGVVFQTEVVSDLLQRSAYAEASNVTDEAGRPFLAEEKIGSRSHSGWVFGSDNTF